MNQIYLKLLTERENLLANVIRAGLLVFHGAMQAQKFPKVKNAFFPMESEKSLYLLHVWLFVDFGDGKL